MSVWSQLLPDTQPYTSSAETETESKFNEEMRIPNMHRLVILMFDQLLATTVSAYSPASAASFKSKYKRAIRQAAKRRRLDGDDAPHIV